MSDRIVNPESVGDPDIQPIVQIDQDFGDWLRDPANGGCASCTGINWFHDSSCRRELHKRVAGGTPTGEYAFMCLECQDYWPCAIARLVYTTEELAQ